MHSMHKMPKGQEKAIVDFIDDKIKSFERNYDYNFNKVLRDDIFRLLAMQNCIVIHFPEEKENNNGFHVKYPLRGELRHFVFINTDKPMEEQIFTAAHELGHIWNLIEEMNSKGFKGESSDTDWEERIINRFAAEILMPKDEFESYAKREISTARKRHPENLLTVGNMILAITAIMNEFFIPYKSVVYRLYELDIISEKSVEILINDNKAIEKLSKAVAKEQGYIRLYQPSYKRRQRRHIDGLKELLDKARDEEAMPEKWLESFYELFKLNNRPNTAFNNSLTGDDSRAECKGGIADAEVRGD